MGLKDSIKKLSTSLGLVKKAEESSSESEQELDLAKLQESDSDSELSSGESEPDVKDDDNEAEADETSVVVQQIDEEDEEDVALSDAELDDDADVIPHQKVTVNNTSAILRSLKSIALPESTKGTFIEHMSITSEGVVELRDIYDDMDRELSFYKQALAAAIEGRKLCKKSGIPFSRPTDFFAEMLKSDEHMERVKSKLVEQERSQRAAQDARKQRELKKFGKKVQNEKLQQRAKERKETLEKIQGLKRKRKNNADFDDDQFVVEVEDALSDKKKNRDDKYKLGNRKGGNAKLPNRKRMAKNNKYGSGHKRGERRNTAESSMDVGDFKNKRRK